MANELHCKYSSEEYYEKKFLCLFSSCFFLFCFSLETAYSSKILVAEAELMNSKGESIGKAVFTESKDGVIIQITASNLSPGAHGLHIHERGKCEGPKFLTAGDHFNPTHTKHGSKNPEGPHHGDLANLEGPFTKKVNTQMVNSAITLKSGKNSILKSGGTALVIHEKTDDQLSDPIGNSGPRIACGVIKKSTETILTNP